MPIGYLKHSIISVKRLNVSCKYFNTFTFSLLPCRFCAQIDGHSFFCVQIIPVLVHGKKKKKKKKDTEIEENFYDIVDMDEGHAQEYIAEKFIPRFLESAGYQTFMMAVIFLNAIELALRTSDELVIQASSETVSHEF